MALEQRTASLVSLTARVAMGSSTRWQKYADLALRSAIAIFDIFMILPAKSGQEIFFQRLASHEEDKDDSSGNTISRKRISGNNYALLSYTALKD
jgi:hypothetical protein